MKIALRIASLAGAAAWIAVAGATAGAGGRDAGPPVPAVRAAPTPYPARADDWPGKGAIRVFEFMKHNRDFFWSERALKQGSIVFAGDSLTASWKTLEANFPGARVANRGIGGDVSRGLLFRFEEDVLALRPRAIVILIGTNDLTARQPASDTLANLRAMLAMRQAHPRLVPVVLCTVPPSADPEATVDETQRLLLNQGLRQLADNSPRVWLVDLHAALSTQQGLPDRRYFAADQLHLSAAGHARWKQALLPALRDAGAVAP